VRRPGKLGNVWRSGLLVARRKLSPGEQVLRPIHANRGVEAAYKRALLKHIVEMINSFEYWLAAAYRKNPPRVVELVEQAQDASPSQHIKKTLDELAKRWVDKFDEWAPKLAELYARETFKATDSAFRQALIAAGWSVEFKMTPAMRDALNAHIDANIALIKSIPEQYHKQVTGVVMRSYSNGRDLATMRTELKALYPAASHRATLIARDQSNKANAVVNRTRQLELGITEAVWMHSHAGKTPRPDHVAADGKRYNIAEGCLISGEYVHPGQEINCRCTSRAIIPKTFN
jgi:SPP1 gp7 family putative phage head morphogenesis protein